MGKGHRDNHAARKKRGSEAFQKKTARRAVDPDRAKCLLCGTEARIKTMTAGLCKSCFKKSSNEYGCVDDVTDEPVCNGDSMSDGGDGG